MSIIWIRSVSVGDVGTNQGPRNCCEQMFGRKLNRNMKHETTDDAGTRKNQTKRARIFVSSLDQATSTMKKNNSVTGLPFRYRVNETEKENERKKKEPRGAISLYWKLSPAAPPPSPPPSTFL